MSALRAQREYGSDSPSPQRQTAQLTQPQRPTTSRVPSAAPRRSSFSIQPFKAPTLAASPLGSSPLAASPRVSTRAIPTLGSLEEEVGPGQTQPTTRKPSTGTSVSSSPRPAPVQRFTSSFSHRPKRPSVDRTNNKTDEDQTSSGKASATSSTQPGSGLMVDPTGGSSGSMQEDDENISDFLKMLDQKKDLLNPASPTAVESSARRTNAALNKFHKMRDSNAALSESMSSSLVVPKPSPTNRQSYPGTTISSSSSPGGKPVSPHTPHTPFAPSRLSAAYSHDDPEMQESASPVEETSGPAVEEAAGAIAIPNSPRLGVPGYRRSSSAQRRPLSSDDDIGDLYGMRSASMGAQQKTGPGVVEGIRRLDLNAGQIAGKDSARETTVLDENVSDSGSARSSLPNASRSRFTSTRGGTRDRGNSHISPARGSLSSVSGTGASIERDRNADADSGSSINASFGRAGRIKPLTQKPESRAAEDDDEMAFLFDMDQSTTHGLDKKKG